MYLDLKILMIMINLKYIVYQECISVVIPDIKWRNQLKNQDSHINYDHPNHVEFYVAPGV